MVAGPEVAAEDTEAVAAADRFKVALPTARHNALQTVRTAMPTATQTSIETLTSIEAQT